MPLKQAQNYKGMNMGIILIKGSHYIMDSRLQNQAKNTLPQLRTNKHFRIRSASKDKLCSPTEILSARPRHKGVADQSKRIFSESRNKKSGSIDTAIKIKIAKEELQRKYQKLRKDTNKKKMIVYEEIRTESYAQPDQNRYSGRVRTFCEDDKLTTLEKVAKICDPNRIVGREKLQETNKVSADSNVFKKNKIDKQVKEPKGKYRCRVNQYVFDHCRKKSSFGRKEEQETIDQFWKNVNESMILAGRQQEEMSKDLRQFVDNFTTE